MEYVKLARDIKHYDYKGANSARMTVIGIFLSDIDDDDLYRDWALANKTDPDSKYAENISGNATSLEDDDGKIILYDGIVEKGTEPDRAVMTKEQFVQLLDDWQEKVCGPRPKEAVIRYENNQYLVETSN